MIKKKKNNRENITNLPCSHSHCGACETDAWYDVTVVSAWTYRVCCKLLFGLTDVLSSVGIIIIITTIIIIIIIISGHTWRPGTHIHLLKSYSVWPAINYSSLIS